MNIVPLTIWREARGEGHTGMLAVAHVIRNRARSGTKLWPSDPEKVCLQRKQFSCWNDTNAERDTYPADKDQQILDAQRIVDSLQDDSLADPTGGATYYVNPAAVAHNPFEDPQFVKVAEIGKHWFYKQKEKA